MKDLNIIRYRPAKALRIYFRLDEWVFNALIKKLKIHRYGGHGEKIRVEDFGKLIKELL